MPITYSCEAWQVIIDKLLNLNSIYIKWNVTIARNLGSSKHNKPDDLNLPKWIQRSGDLSLNSKTWYGWILLILSAPPPRSGWHRRPAGVGQGSLWSVEGFSRDQVLHVPYSSLLRHDKQFASPSTSFYKLEKPDTKHLTEQHHSRLDRGYCFKIKLGLDCTGRFGQPFCRC